ncbi:hypothetical protein BpHYR1_045020 [Brachionus plicatilis]|uniref:SWIM-type domain-containing protein n=1 Tax=Brachionus plicatilis TaxID=10195 RepID=A0A3M7RJC6_BRAPC|nr:hypothetical protein BpHYR1_045020 [Brachionus plicatilis]
MDENKWTLLEEEMKHKDKIEKDITSLHYTSNIDKFLHLKNELLSQCIAQKKFDLTIKRDNVLITESDNLTLLDFNIIDNNSAYRVYDNTNKYFISLRPKYCSCVYYLEHGICKHFVALSRLTYTPLEDDLRDFVCVRKRGKPPKSNNGALSKK